MYHSRPDITETPCGICAYPKKGKKFLQVEKETLNATRISKFSSIVALVLFSSPRSPLHNRTASLFQLAQEKWKETIVELVLLLLLLLLLVMLLLLVWRSVLATMLLLSVMRLVSLVLVATAISAMLRRDRVSALEIDVYPSSIILCAILESQLAA